MKPRRLAVSFKRSGQSRARRAAFTNPSSTPVDGIALPSTRLLSAVVALAFAVVGLFGVGASQALATGDANQASCPNEGLLGFSPALPDCRALEMVTPAFKGGFTITYEGFSPDGSNVIAGSLGSFAGNEAAPQTRNDIGNVYEMTRTAAGWKALSITPLNPTFRSAATYYAASADGSASLFSMPSAPAGQDDFYVVRDGGASITDLGHATPPSKGPTVEPASPEQGGPGIGYFGVRGATPDLSHLLFFVNNGFTFPGDETCEACNTLYEYSEGQGGDPVLVGVTGGLGSKELIGKCGVEPGAPGGTAFNAESGDGAVVFFTPASADGPQACGASQPATAQLYARIDQRQTVHLSAPECTLAWCEATPQSDALFSGAAASGQRAFFLSTQRLDAEATEDEVPEDTAFRNAGTGCQLAIGSGCNLYEYDLADQRLTAISAGTSSPHVQGVVRVSNDGSRVYFVATSVLTAQPNPEGALAQAGADNLYVYEPEPAAGSAPDLHFIATVLPEDEELWGGQGGNDEGRPAESTADGQFLLFQSHADLTSDDTNTGVSQVFEYRAGPSPQLRRISIGDRGFANDGNTPANSAFFVTQEYGFRTWWKRQHHMLSADGETVVFQSPAALTPGAPALQPGGSANTYEYRGGRVFLIATGSAAERGSVNALLGIDPSGEDIFFKTQARLLAGDVDTQVDVYDARSLGGTPPPAAECAAGSCFPPGTAPEPLPSPGSALFSGQGNPHPSSRAAALRACRHRTDKQRRKRCEQNLSKHHYRGVGK